MKQTIYKLICLIFIIAYVSGLLLDRIIVNTKIITIDDNLRSSLEEIAEFDISDEIMDEIMDQIKTSNSKISNTVKKLYKAVLADIKCFPIPINNDKYSYNYINSWKSERTYGGNRKHYGTDIMDAENQAGNIPIISMTDGVIENIGWLELGGWRIGIRAKHGAYFYYAHLDSFKENLKKGSKINVGEIIGYMGNSGYGKIGTVNKFDVHLHIGIALHIKNVSNEFWINPYWILKHIEDVDV